MLVREDGAGVLLIGQPSHARISGQLARAWGNQDFGVVEPYEEVCLAAEQHDVGWALLDLEPTLNPETGLPYSFMEMPLDVHLDLWTAGPRRLLSQSRYAALLVSMHGWRLYKRRDLDKLSPADADAIRSFLEGQRAFQRELIVLLQSAPDTALVANPQLIERNSLLLWAWDYLSLAACLDWAPARAKRVPTANGEVDLELTPGTEHGRLLLDPWPFSTDTVTVRCEGRRLDDRYETDDGLERALATAHWETVEFRLTPNRSKLAAPDTSGS